MTGRAADIKSWPAELVEPFCMVHDVIELPSKRKGQTVQHSCEFCLMSTRHSYFSAIMTVSKRARNAFALLHSSALSSIDAEAEIGTRSLGKIKGPGRSIWMSEVNYLMLIVSKRFM